MIQVGAAHTVIRFVSIRAKLGLSTVVVLNLGVNGTIIEAKIYTLKTPECKAVNREDKRSRR